MINFSDITRAVEALLETELDANGSASRYFVKRSEYTNQNPDKTPWVGVYRGTTTYEPRSLGNSLCNWRALPKIKIVVQAASRKSGPQAEERCEVYTQEVLNALLTDYSLGGTVETIIGIESEPLYNRDENGTLHFHMNVLTISVQTKTGRGA